VKKIFHCECDQLEHTSRFTYYPEDDELYIDTTLMNHNSFFKRTWIGLKYIFGVVPNDVDFFDCTLLYGKRIDDLINTLTEWRNENFPKEQKPYLYKSGFKEGERVVIVKQSNKYNRHIYHEIGKEATVLECPSEDWPDDAVQINIGNGIGAIDIDCLKRVLK
jgi:hypothetical protein